MIAATNLDASRLADNGSYSSALTDSVSPSPFSLLMLTVGEIANSGGVALPSISGLSLTWNEVDSVSYTGNGTNTLSIFYAIIRGIFASGQITITPAQTDNYIYWTVDQLTGVDLTNPIVQHATGTSLNTNSVSVPLNPFANTNNAAFMGGHASGGGAVTAGSGMTLLGSLNAAKAMGSEWGVNQASPVVNFQNNNNNGGVACEIKALLIKSLPAEI